jgi:putative transposase
VKVKIKTIIVPLKKIFKSHCFPKAIILQAAQFKLRCSLSYRDEEELLSIIDVKVDHATIQRLYLSALPV